MSHAGYHSIRLQADSRRKTLWETLVAHEFQKNIPPRAVVLDLGAGHGDFINSVKAHRRLAVDVWPGMLDHLAPGVEGMVTEVSRLEAIADNSVDYVFSSNCFEHVPRPQFLECLDQLRRKMKPGATLNIIQPNYKYCSREYFDDYTHVAIYSDTGMADLLAANGFKITRRIPRFIPLTLKGRLPVTPWLIRLYLASPVKPLAKQMFISAIR